MPPNHGHKSKRPKSFYDLIRENCYVAPMTATSVAELGESVEDDVLLQQHDRLDDAMQPALVPWTSLKSLAPTKKDKAAQQSPNASLDSSDLYATCSSSSLLDSEEEAALMDYFEVRVDTAAIFTIVSDAPFLSRMLEQMVLTISFPLI